MGVDWDTLVIGPTVGTFGDQVVYTPAAGGSFSITGVFDRAFLEVTMLDSSIGSTVEAPILGVQLSQFTALGQALPIQGDTVTIVTTNTLFKVKEVQTDGHGWAKLVLNQP